MRKYLESFMALVFPRNEEKEPFSTLQIAVFYAVVVFAMGIFILCQMP